MNFHNSKFISHVHVAKLFYLFLHIARLTIVLPLAYSNLFARIIMVRVMIKD